MQIPVPLVRAWLRQAFARWGLPERLRVDNGWPWGNHNDLPTALALWLLGLGVDLIWNRPGRPQENGKVERHHGLIDQWGEPKQCPDWATWEQRIAWVVRMQREVYPAVGGKSRLAAHPALLQNPRRYGKETEAAWDERRVYAWFAGGLWRRRVGKKGQVTLYHRTYSVGCRHAGQQVFVRLDPETVSWVIQDHRGQELGRYPAAELARERILALDVSFRKPHERRAAQARRVPNLIAYMVT